MKALLAFLSLWPIASPGGVGYRHEFQIHEGDVGSYWARRTRVEITARATTDLPESIRKARPFLAPPVPTLGGEMLVYDPRSPLVPIEGRGEWQIRPSLAPQESA